LEQVLGFCLEHIDILAYQQLITHLMTDFATTLEPVYGELGFLPLILRMAVQRTLEVHKILLKKCAQDQADMVMSLHRSRVGQMIRFQKVPTDFEPVNWKGKRIPTAKWLIGGVAAPHDLSGKLTERITVRLEHFDISAQDHGEDETAGLFVVEFDWANGQ
jgi:hypothetical protein